MNGKHQRQYEDPTPAELEAYGNNHQSWIVAATGLVQSGGVLAKQVHIGWDAMLGPKRYERPPEDQAAVELMKAIYSPMLMLYAFAAECLIKALYLKRGGVLYEGGQLARRKKPVRPAHNLESLIKSLELQANFTVAEMNLLDRLSVNTDRGRFPAHSSISFYGIQPPLPGSTALNAYLFWAPKDSEEVATVIQRLYSLNDEVAPPGVTALFDEYSSSMKNYQRS